MTIYFDIDSTVFMTKMFTKTRIDPAVQEILGISVEQLAEINDRYYATLTKGTDFNFNEYARFISEDSATVEAITRLFTEKKLYKGMVYPDVEPILQLLKDRGDTIGIYSEGFQDYQMYKLQHTEILPFFDANHMHIARRKQTDEVVAKLEDGALIIDDKLEYLQTVPESCTPLWIQRNENEGVPTIATIRSLEEIERFLE